MYNYLKTATSKTRFLNNPISHFNTFFTYIQYRYIKNVTPIPSPLLPTLRFIQHISVPIALPPHLYILLAHSAGVVSRQSHGDGVVDVGPFGVVVEGLGEEGNSGHERPSWGGEWE
jgi:hypothetical protein